MDNFPLTVHSFGLGWDKVSKFNNCTGKLQPLIVRWALMVAYLQCYRKVIFLQCFCGVCSWSGLVIVCEDLFYLYHALEPADIHSRMKRCEIPEKLVQSVQRSIHELQSA
jgi:hypothetical protein